MTGKIIATVLVCIFLAIGKLKNLAETNADKDRYVGFGWKLHCRDGKITVLSRLLDSPCGYAEVEIGSRLISMDGIDLDSTYIGTFGEFLAGAGRSRDIGDISTFIIEDSKGIREVVLTTEMIQGPIPYNKPLVLMPEERSLVEIRMYWCSLTGQFIFTYRLRDTAVNSVLSCD
jgi:hypothetical protein